MKKQMITLSVLLLIAGSARATTNNIVAAQQAYQEGLFLQRTIGDMAKALAAYDRALKAATDAEDADLVESVLLRRSEVFDALGRSVELQTTIAALRKEPTNEGPDLGPAAFFPPELDLLLHIDIQGLLKSPLIESLGVDAEIGGEDIEKLKEVLGFDPMKDLQSATAGVTLSDNEDMPVEHWVLQLRGRLGKLDLEKVLKMQGAKAGGVENFVVKTLSIHGTKVLSFRVPLDQDPKQMMTIGFAQPESDMFLAGDLQAIKRTLAARAGKATGLRANQSIMHVISRVPDGSSFWMAGTVQKILSELEELGNLPGLPAGLPKIDGVLLAGTLAEDIHVSATAWTPDKQAASLLGDILQGLLAIAQLAPIDEPLVKKVISSLGVETAEHQVSVSLTVPGELVMQHSPEKTEKTVRRLVMKIGDRRSVSFPGVESLLIENPKVADIDKRKGDRVSVKALGEGETTLCVKRKGKSDISMHIKVVR